MKLLYPNKLIIVLLLFSHSFFPMSCDDRYQADKMVELSQKYCNRLTEIDSSEEPDEVTIDKMMLAAKELGEKNEELVEAIKQDIANQINSTDQKKVSYRFATKFVLNLLETRPAYSKMVRLQLPKPARKIKQSLICPIG